MNSIISQVALSAFLLSSSCLAAPASFLPSDLPDSPANDKNIFRLFRRYYYYDNGGGFPTAAIAGIVIGVVIFIAGIAIRCCFIYNARKRSKNAFQNVAQYQGTSMQQNPGQAPGPQPYNPNNPAAGNAGMVGSPGNVNYAGMYNGYTGYSAGYDNNKMPGQTAQPVQGFAPPQQPPPQQQNYQVAVATPSPPPAAHVNNNSSFGYDVAPTQNTAGYQSAQVYDPTSNQSSAPEIRYGR